MRGMQWGMVMIHKHKRSRRGSVAIRSSVAIQQKGRSSITGRWPERVWLVVVTRKSEQGMDHRSKHLRKSRSLHVPMY